MGATDSKLAFRKGVFRLFEERVSFFLYNRKNKKVALTRLI